MDGPYLTDGVGPYMGCILGMQIMGGETIKIEGKGKDYPATE